MSNLRPIADPDAIAGAILACDALGLAGSSEMAGFARVSLARELVLRIAAAKATLQGLADSTRGRDMDAIEEARWDAAEAEEETCRAQLKTLISERLGVCADDLWSVL